MLKLNKYGWGGIYAFIVLCLITLPFNIEFTTKNVFADVFNDECYYVGTMNDKYTPYWVLYGPYNWDEATKKAMETEVDTRWGEELTIIKGCFEVVDATLKTELVIKDPQ